MTARTDLTAPTPLTHLGLELGRLRLLVLDLLETAASRGWLRAGPRTDGQLWPSLDEVRRALLHGRPDGGVTTEAAGRAQARLIDDLLSRPGADRLPIPQLTAAFALPRAAVDTLLLAAGCATDPALRAAVQLWQRDPRAVALDAELARLLAGGRLDPFGALLRHRLLAADERFGRTLLSAPSSAPSAGTLS